MKKLACGLVLSASVVFSVMAIAVNVQENQVKMKSLIVYYSFTGNTELVAKTMADILKADLLKIEDVTKPSKEEAYGAGKEASKQGKAWPVKPFNKDLSGYDRIFAGCPVWFGMPTPEFNAFVEQVDFAGKQVVVFVTLGGGSPDGAIKAMTEKITAKGGKVVSSFYIRTKNAGKADIEAKAKEISKQY